MCLCCLPLATFSYQESEQSAPLTKAGLLLLEQDYGWLNTYKIQYRRYIKKCTVHSIVAWYFWFSWLTQWLITAVPTGVWFSVKLTDGMVRRSHVYEASDLLLDVSPKEAKFILFGPVVSDSADEPWHPKGQGGMIWRHGQQHTQKKLFPHLVLQRRCILVRVPHGVTDVTVSGVWTASRVKFSNSLSEHPLIHTDVPTCSDRPKLLTDTALK